MKTCTKCLQEKPFEGFYKRSLSPDGFEALCKVCRLAHNKRWVEQNKERHNELTKSWYEKNRQKHLVRSKQYYETHKHNYIEYSNARDKHIKIAMPPWADRKQIRLLYEQARNLTNQTGIQHDVDHIIPLRGKNVCGLHVPENLQVISSSQNKRKAAKFNQESLNVAH